MDSQKVLILNFGGQYVQLIARRVRECGVYCEVKPYTTTIEEIRAFAPVGIIFTGGPNSVYAENSPHPSEKIFSLGIPVLGICYGCQLLACHLGGKVAGAVENSSAEYGKTTAYFNTDCALFNGLKESSVVWMSHGDYIEKMPQGFYLAAKSDKCPAVGIADENRKFYGVQFHPEVNHTEEGRKIIENFLCRICGANKTWVMKNYLKQAISDVKNKVKDGKALLALSGGVDSSVLAGLLSKALGRNLTCVFVDHGLMRKDEGEQVENAFKEWDINFVRIDAEERFLKALKGKIEPEEKRKAVGKEFIRIFEEIGKRIGKVDYLAQGTIYPDVIESGKGDAQTIKSHHNVGGLPDFVDFKEIIEPLRMLFKDEVRALGKELGLPEALVNRQPFPGPGLSIRIIGEVTKEKLELLRAADAIFREEMEKANIKGGSSQYFAALTNMRSVGVKGDGRSYEYAVALRAVDTEDFMTCDWTRIPYEVLDKVSVRIVNEVKGVNRILYDITSKPPATVEFE